ncbi:MAG: hypothetical protein Tsb009_12840 [Planctomycetaceae bacterium]
MHNGQQVLIVDGLRETAEVLKLALQPRDVTVSRIRSRNSLDNSENDSSQTPNVVIVHQNNHNQQVEQTPPLDNRWANVPRVVIGSEEPNHTEKSSPFKEGERYLANPFQYSELVQMIEQLLSDSAIEESSRLSSKAA